MLEVGQQSGQWETDAVQFPKDREGIKQRSHESIDKSTVVVNRSLKELLYAFLWSWMGPIANLFSSSVDSSIASTTEKSAAVAKQLMDKSVDGSANKSSNLDPSSLKRN